MSDKTYNKKILASLRHLFGNSVYNRAINQNASNRLRCRSTLLFWVSLILLAVSLATDFLRPATTILGVVLIAIRYWGQFDSRSIKHDNTAKSYRDIRDRLIVLIGDYMSGMVSDSEAVEMRDVIKGDINCADTHALSTTNRDYRKAQKNLSGKAVKGEHFTFSDEEIDRWLPKELRVTDS